MKINIEINTDNQAFEFDKEEEISRILKELINNNRLWSQEQIKLFDYNGNSIGIAKIINENRSE
tara:strand:- start:2148 stop:2339 length:192 start_codon:yes stop_codon:yes gene_type:complete